MPPSRIAKKIWRWLSVAVAVGIQLNVTAANLTSLDPSKFASLDSDRGICAQLGADRISKWLILKAADNPEQEINASFLRETLANAITDGSLVPLLCQDLRKGDQAIRNTLAKLLYTYNFGEEQVNGLLENWAAGGPDDNLIAIFGNAAHSDQSLSVLTEYFMQSDLNWVKAVAVCDQIIGGKTSTVSVDLLRQALINTAGVDPRSARLLTDRAQSGDLKAKGEIATQLPKILLSNGALARFIREREPPEDSLYVSIWNRVATRIAREPLILDEYIRRSMAAAQLYDSISEILVKAIQQYGARRLFPNLVKASAIPKSRFAYLVQELSINNGLNGFGRPISMNPEDAQLEMNRRLANLCMTKSAWVDFMLWHLTRPAEAVCITFREQMPQIVKDDPILARALAKRPGIFGAAFESKLLGTDAYSFYSGGAAELQSRLQAQRVEDAALLRYSSAIANLLKSSDSAWSDAMNYLAGAPSEEPIAAFKALLAASLDKDNLCSFAWARTIQQNDQVIFERFRQFLLAKGQAQDPENFRHWLDSINAAYRTSDVAGNQELASFKETFAQFIASPGGWDAAFSRLAIESIDIPYAIRGIMSLVCRRDDELFWKVYSVACATSGLSVATLKPRMLAFANETELPKFLLDEIANQNQLASDAVDPIWERLLRKDGPLVAKILSDVKEGLALSQQFSLSAYALNDALNDTEVWKLAAPQVNAFLGGIDPEDPTLQTRFKDRLSVDSEKLAPILVKLLENTDLQERWRQSLLKAVRFDSKAYVVAGLIRTNYGLAKEWANTVGTLITSDPIVLRYMLESLAARRIGSARWTANLESMRASLMTIILSDRVLIEQLLVDKNHGYRTDLLNEAARLFGGEVAKQWQ